MSDINDTSWHIKKEVQLGHIITTLAMAASCLLYVTKIENRVAMLEDQGKLALSSQHERDEVQDKRNAELMSLLRAQLDKMDAKLDRLVEKRK